RARCEDFDRRRLQDRGRHAGGSVPPHAACRAGGEVCTVEILRANYSAAIERGTPLTRVSPLTLSTVTCVSYQVSRGRTPNRSVNWARRASVTQASAAARLSHR